MSDEGTHAHGCKAYAEKAFIPDLCDCGLTAKLYGHAHRLHELEPHYSRHVSAMTTEALHAKSDIAAELAWRDKELAASLERERRVREALELTRPILNCFMPGTDPADTYEHKLYDLAHADVDNSYLRAKVAWYEERYPDARSSPPRQTGEPSAVAHIAERPMPIIRCPVTYSRTRCSPFMLGIEGLKCELDAKHDCDHMGRYVAEFATEGSEDKMAEFHFKVDP